MKLRTLFIAGLLAAGFVYLTSNTRWLPESLRQRLGATAPLWSGPSVARSAGLSADEVNNIDIYKSANAATVNITSTVYRRGFFFDIYPVKESGSGFLINADGLIVTNNHVVGGSAKLQVTLADQKRYEAETLVKDPANDLALIRIRPTKKLQHLNLGDSDKMQVGQKVLAIGNPFGFHGTLTTGIVSSLGRSIRDETGRELEGMIQTDSAINPGNSGGPLLDSQGNVVGVNTAIYGPGGNIGIGFAMPINRAKAMLTDYQAGRSFQRPRLGVSVIHVAGDLATALDLPAEGGLLVQEVVRGSAAEAAGIRGPRSVVVIGNNEVGIGGDLITAIDGRPVESGDAIRRALERKRAGDPLELSIYRGRRTTKVRVQLGGAPDERL